MPSSDSVGMGFVGLCLLVVFPLGIWWDLTHPEARPSNVGSDPSVYLPFVALAYVLFASVFMAIYWDRCKAADKQRIRNLIMQSKIHLQNGRLDAAEATIAAAKKLVKRTPC